MGEPQGSDELLQKAMAKFKQAKNKIARLEHEPIAIIGIGCRFPGNVNNPEDFWRLLKEGQDAIIDIPPNRWDADAYYDPNKDAPGKMYVKKGGFLQQPVDEFDAAYFGISPKEAEDMDPQQRISLEVAVDAIESSGIPLDSLNGSRTGVYMGICFNDYGHLITQSGDIAAVDRYYSTGNHYSVLSGRIAYVFGLNGPAISLDTACSSSLVTIDTAVKDLRFGRCDLALAGGVNLILAPEATINFCKSGMLSPDGHCKTFDASADGYVRGEGCAILVLKRLSDAVKDGNPILAVIRGTSVNQDGASTGLTVPNGRAQQKVIQEALENAQVQPQDVTYVEAHGTGTSLGDPIEVEALANVYSKNRTQPLFIGSVKTNIGHTEAAAGVAGVIKVVLSLIHRTIPKHLHFTKINPHVHLDNMQIAQENITLPEGPIFAAVSSFGFSGTNAHIVLENGPKPIVANLSHNHPFDRKRYWIKREGHVLIRVEQEILVSQLEHIELSERRNHIKSFVSDTLRGVLAIPASEPIDEEKGFFDMGLDSIMAVELKKRIQQGLGKSIILETSALFDHSSVEKMTRYLAEMLGLGQAALKEKSSHEQIEGQILKELENLDQTTLLEELKKELENE